MTGRDNNYLKSNRLIMFAGIGAGIGMIVVFICIVVFKFFDAGCITGDSMEPTFFSGDCLVYRKNRSGSLFSRGDVVSLVTNKVKFSKDADGLLKRVIGLPGEIVEISDHEVFINGKLLEEPYAKWEYSPLVISSNMEIPKTVYDAALENCVTDLCNAGTVKSWRVPEGTVFVLGDNRYGCLDSRALGPVPIEDVRMKVVLRIVPFSEAGFLGSYKYSD